MRKIVHISDLHFGGTDATVVDALVRDIESATPHLVIVSGDLTMGARNKEFREARAFLDRLAVPYLSVPGNHDVSPYALLERFVKPFARYQRWIGQEPEPFFQDEEIAVVGLNSARSWGWSWNWAHGRLSHDQVERAATRFDGVPATSFKIAVLHHPVIEPPPGSDQRIVGRLPAALDLLDQAGTDLILAGHLHVGQSHQYRLSEDREILALQASTATSRRQRGEANSYNRITVNGTCLDIEMRSYGQGAFEQTSRTEWRKGDAGWRMLSPQAA